MLQSGLRLGRCVLAQSSFRSICRKLRIYYRPNLRSVQRDTVQWPRRPGLLPKVARTLPDSTSSMSETRARNRWLIESYHKRVATRYPAPAGEQLGIIGWMVTGEFRKDVDRAIDAGDAAAAARMLAAAWELEPGSPLAGFVASRYDRIAGDLGLLKQRWAILRSFTVEPVLPRFEGRGICRGYRAGNSPGRVQRLRTGNPGPGKRTLPVSAGRRGAGRADAGRGAGAVAGRG